MRFISKENWQFSRNWTFFKFERVNKIEIKEVMAREIERILSGYWTPGVASSESNFSGTEITVTRFQKEDKLRDQNVGGDCPCRYIEIDENYKQRRKTSQKLKTLPIFLSHISLALRNIYHFLQEKQEAYSSLFNVGILHCRLFRLM